MFKARLESLQEYIFQPGTLHLDDAIAACEKLAQDARDTPYEGDAVSLKDKAEAHKKEAQTGALTRAQAAVDKRVNDEDYAGALAVIDGLDGGFKDIPAFRQLMERREQIRTWLLAKALSDHIQARASELIDHDELDRAAGMLKAFYLFDGFESTPWAAGIKDLEARLKQAQQDRQAQGGDDVYWRTVFDARSQDLTDWDLGSHPEFWQIDGGEMVGKNTGDDRAAATVRGGDYWLDYQVSFSFKIERGGFEVGVRGAVEAGARRFFLVDPSFRGQDDGRWHRVKMNVSGMRVEWTNPEGEDSSGRTMTNEKGALGLILLTDSVVRFKDVRVRVTAKEDAPDEEELPGELDGEGGWGGTEGFEGEDEDGDDSEDGGD